MLTDDGSQRRTPGGVYFKLVQNQTEPKEHWAIFCLTRSAVPKAKPQLVTCLRKASPKGGSLRFRAMPTGWRGL